MAAAFLGSAHCSQALTTGSNPAWARGIEVAFAQPCALGKGGLGKGKEQRVARGPVAQRAVA